MLPFILFSPFVGWLSDRFCKARIIQFMALLQICVLAGMYWSLRVHNLNGAILWFCVFAVQATVFSPAKKGIVKDIVGTSRMGFASGIVEMASILSLLIGQIGVFIWFRYLLEPSTDTIWHRWLGEGFFQWFDAWLKPSGINDGWYAASFPCLVFLLLAVPVAASSFRLPRYAPGGAAPSPGPCFTNTSTSWASCGKPQSARQRDGHRLFLVLRRHGHADDHPDGQGNLRWRG